MHLCGAVVFIRYRLPPSHTPKGWSIKDKRLKLIKPNIQILKVSISIYVDL